MLTHVDNYLDYKTFIHYNCTEDVWNRVLNEEIQTTVDHGIFDFRTAGHFLPPNAPMKTQTTYNKSTVYHPSWWLHNCIHKHLPTGYTTTAIKSTLPNLAHSSLISIKHFCNAGYTMDYDSTRWYICFKINIIIQGLQDENTKLWKLPLQTTPTSTPSSDNNILKLASNKTSKHEDTDGTIPTFRTAKLVKSISNMTQMSAQQN